MAILPTDNSVVDGNAKDPCVNDVDHDDDNCENNVVTGFRQVNSAFSPEVRHV